MKVCHRPEIDFVSIDFKDKVESKSFFQDGIIVRLDEKGNIIGLDITDSSQFFAGTDKIGLREACDLLGISESTMRRRIKAKQIPYTKPNGKDYQFKKSDILKLVA